MTATEIVMAALDEYVDAKIAERAAIAPPDHAQRSLSERVRKARRALQEALWFWRENER